MSIRKAFPAAKRVLVNLAPSVVTQKGKPSFARIGAIVDQVASLVKEGKKEAVLVVAKGPNPAVYEALFDQHGVKSIAVNSTNPTDVKAEAATLLANGTVPIISQDAESEAARIAQDISADLLVMLSNVDGHVDLGDNGMRDKVKAALSAAQQQVKAVIANGRTENVVTRIVNGENVGTVITHEPDTSLKPLEICQRARQVLWDLCTLNGVKRTELLHPLSEVEEILPANEVDLTNASKNNLDKHLLACLELTKSTLEIYAQGILDISNRPDHIGVPCDLNKFQLPTSWIPPEIRPRRFLGTRWLDGVCKKILQEVEDTRPRFRVPPMCMARHSKGGKTKSLLEIAHKLTKDHGVATIFVSFNDTTPYGKKEAEQVSPLQSLMARIAWVCAEKRPDGPLCDYDGLHHSADTNALLSWLRSIPRCVLLIDELNVLFNREMSTQENRTSEEEGAFQELASFLTLNFCDKQGRYFVFSSHVIATRDSLAQYMPSPSLRAVGLKSLPNVKTMDCTPDELKWFFEEFKDEVSSYCGFSPGLCWTYIHENDVFDTLKMKMQKELHQGISDEWIREFLNCLFEGGDRNLTQCWDRFTDTQIPREMMRQIANTTCFKRASKKSLSKKKARKNPKIASAECAGQQKMLAQTMRQMGEVSAQSRGNEPDSKASVFDKSDVFEQLRDVSEKLTREPSAIWSPMMLATGLQCIKHQNFYVIGRILQKGPDGKAGDGMAWENLIVATIALRCLNHLYENLNNVDDGILPPLPEKFDFFIKEPPRIATVEGIMKEYSPENAKQLGSGKASVTLVIPQQQNFPIFDAFLFVKDGPRSYRWGYQMKQSRDKPSTSAHSVHAAIVFQGIPPRKQETKLLLSETDVCVDGLEVPWSRLSRQSLARFLGVSLHLASPMDRI